MAKYMVVETFIDNGGQKVYDRFAKKGRMLPEGLLYIDSWRTEDGGRCFQLMETNQFALFQEWVKQWDDLVDFEILEIAG